MDRREVSAPSRPILGTSLMVLGLTFMGCGEGPSAPIEGLRLEAVSTSVLRGLPGEPLLDPLTVRVVDADGTARAGVPVRFEVVSGGGRVTPAASTTDGLGRIDVRWTLGGGHVRTQELEATLLEPDAGAPLRFEATALRPDETDVVIVSRALGPLRGLVLVREDGPQSRLEVIQERGPAGNAAHLQPMDGGTSDIVVFPSANALERRTVRWTSGADTVRIELRPPVPVDLRIRVMEGPFEERKATVLSHLETTAAIWADQSVGLTLGEVEILDRTSGNAGRRVDLREACDPGSPARPPVEVDYVQAVIGAETGGLACLPATVFMGAATGRFPSLLTHEIGHLLALPHRPSGVMNGDDPGQGFTDGEIFRMHFSEASVVNSLFDGQPDSVRRPCSLAGQHELRCLPTTYQLPGASP